MHLGDYAEQIFPTQSTGSNQQSADFSPCRCPEFARQTALFATRYGPPVWQWEYVTVTAKRLATSMVKGMLALAH